MNNSDIRTITVGLPSKYFQNKAIMSSQQEEVPELLTVKEQEQKDLDEEIEAMIEKDLQELPTDIPKKNEVITVDDIIDSDDPTLSDMEKLLSHKQRKFAKLYATGKYSGKKAAIEAGYSESCAASEASGLLRNPKVLAVIKERTPIERRLENLSKEYLIERYLRIADKAEQAVPVLDREGKPTGLFTFDGNLAVKALSEVAKLTGLEKAVKEEAEKASEKASTKDVNIFVDIMGIANKIKKKEEKK